jgi:hypothetical protein
MRFLSQRHSVIFEPLLDLVQQFEPVTQRMLAKLAKCTAYVPCPITSRPGGVGGS